MKKEDVEILRSFDLTIPVPGLTLSDKLRLCNAFDGFEIIKGIQDVLVIDTLEFDSSIFTLKVSLKKPLTYKEIDEFLQTLFTFTCEMTGVPISTKDVSVRWEVSEYGRPSVFFDREIWEQDTKRYALFADLKDMREKEVSTERKYHIKGGTCYLLESTERAFEIFLDEVHHGVQGLLITRTYPEKMRQEFDLKKTPIFWLTQNRGNYCIHPQDLVELSHVVREFLERSEGAVILLQGTEYLVTQNHFDFILKLFQTINDQISQTSSAMLVPFNRETLPSEQFCKLETELVRL
jgi:hypothetical protein